MLKTKYIKYKCVKTAIKSKKIAVKSVCREKMVKTHFSIKIGLASLSSLVLRYNYYLPNFRG